MATSRFSAGLLILLGIMCARGKSVRQMANIRSSPSVDCQNQPQSSYPFCNPKLNPEDRASDLVSRLNLAELIAQTSSIAPAIPRLGIKDYNWRSNCVHGWTANGGHWLSDLSWTVFPAPIGIAATFNKKLVSQIGTVTATEGRALHNIMLASFNGSSTEAAGLNCFSPNVNLFRDPRWGRGEETFGEDPYMLSVLGVAYTTALQDGEDKNYLKIAACPKHFAVHSGPDNIRSTFVASTSMHDLYDTYLPAFKSQVMAAKAAQIMPAYSGMQCPKSPDGAPDAANQFLLISVLREAFNAPNISIISDNGGIKMVYDSHHYVPTAVDAAAVCMNATTDLDLGNDEIYSNNLMVAVQQEKCSADAIKAAVWRSFLLRIKLGDFDPMDMVPYQKLNASVLNTNENKQLNLQSAQQSMVLLKNVKSTLPINRTKLQRIAIIGPNANSTDALLSNYQGIPDVVVSVEDGIRIALQSYSVQMSVAYGCNSTVCSSMDGFLDALEAAEKADYVIMVMGTDSNQEGEGNDRESSSCGAEEKDAIGLPGCQSNLVEAVISVNPRVILVLVNGGPISFHDLLMSNGVLAVLEAFYPGALGGTAVANALFGECNPAGRMPVSTFINSSTIPSSTDYDMTSPPGRTYRYYAGDALSIPFGFGLSYTSFQYSNVSLSATSVTPCESLRVSARVTNVGKMSGEEVVQVYLFPPTLKPFFPRLQLVAFERTEVLSPLATHTVSFAINSYLMSLVDVDGVNYIFPGKYSLSVSGTIPESGDLGVGFVITGDSAVPVSSCAGVPQCLAC